MPSWPKAYQLRAAWRHTGQTQTDRQTDRHTHTHTHTHTHEASALCTLFTNVHIGHFRIREKSSHVSTVMFPGPACHRPKSNTPQFPNHSLLIAEPNALMTMDVRLGYRNKGDPVANWTEIARSTEERTLKCVAKKVGTVRQLLTGLRGRLGTLKSVSLGLWAGAEHWLSGSPGRSKTPENLVWMGGWGLRDAFRLHMAAHLVRCLCREAGARRRFRRSWTCAGTRRRRTRCEPNLHVSCSVSVDISWRCCRSIVVRHISGSTS